MFIRGGNSKYNLVMVDGIPLNDFGGDFLISRCCPPKESSKWK